MSIFSLLDTFSLTHALVINSLLPFDKRLPVVDRKVALLILAVNDFLSLAKALVTACHYSSQICSSGL